MESAKHAVKESLLGIETEQDLSAQTQATFFKHAKTNNGTAEAYMSEEEFVDAIAPTSENYVSQTKRLRVASRYRSC